VWWAGWSWGPRFLVPLLPLLALASAFWASRSSEEGYPGARSIFLTLGVLGVLLTWNGILFDFVPYYSWIEKTMGIRIGAAAQFRLEASPLVSGWRFLTTTTVDLPAVRLWREGRTGAFLVAAAIDLTLLYSLVWSARRLRNLSRGNDSLHCAKSHEGVEHEPAAPV
jgi:hypothetical protein